MTGFLLDPFRPLFMQHALAELALLAVAGGALGAFVVLRRLAFATHALGVGTFPGAVVAYAAGGSAFLGGLAAALVLALVLALLQRRGDLDAPAATGLVMAGALALGSLLVSNVVRAGPQVDTLLFGSLLGVGREDVLRSAAVAALTTLAVLLLGRVWLLVAFDRGNAPALGFRPAPFDLALFVVLAVTVVASVDAVGALLVSALLVVPAATARLFVGRLVPLLVVSGALALVLAVVGLWLGYRLNAPPGATVAAVAAGAFVLAFAAREVAA
jgi:ABC-type Mn2+/Zn2+ transport system permease subunit